MNIVAAWACKETVIKSENNAVLSTKEVFIKVGSDEKIMIKVPIIVNTRQVLAGEEIVVLKPACEVHEDEPPAKKAKPMPEAAAVGKGKPAGTGKGSESKSNGKNKSDGKKGKGKKGAK